MKKIVLFIVSLSIATGCAARNAGVVIDPTGVRMDQYQSDLIACQQIATQVNSKAGGGAIGGAVVGGLIGATVGNSKTAQKGAGVGAVAGLARGARASKRERLMVTKNCLRNRGYAVLN